MISSEEIVSNIIFNLKNKIGELVSFNGQCSISRLSIKEV